MLLVVQYILLKFVRCIKIADDFRRDVTMRDFIVVDGKILNQLLVSLLKRFCGFAVIPDKAQMRARSGNALELLFGFGSVEPMESLCTHNQIDRIIFQVSVFRTAVQADEVCIFLQVSFGSFAHRFVGFHAIHGVAVFQKQFCRQARAAADIGYHIARHQADFKLQGGDDFFGIARAVLNVVFYPSGEALFEVHA